MEASALEQAAVELSVVMPCLNEAETLQICIAKAQETLRAANILGEVIVADNGSTDGSQQLALECGCLLYTSPSPRDLSTSRMPSSA